MHHDDPGGDGVQVHLLISQFHLARFETVEVKHLTDHLVYALRTIEYVRSEGSNLLIGQASVADQLAPTLNPDQRRARLVADHRGEARDHAVEVLQGGKVRQRLASLAFDGREPESDRVQPIGLRRHALIDSSRLFCMWPRSSSLSVLVSMGLDR